MSITIPEKLSKQKYDELLNRLKKFDLTKYTNLIKENYKKPKEETEYFLEDNIEDPVRINLDYVFKRMSDKQAFDNLQEIAQYLRLLLEDKKYVLLFAYNGTGKTRLSAEFKTLGQTLNEETRKKEADTLYYNAFTEDLFYWDNDLENDTSRVLKLNRNSNFFSFLKDLGNADSIRTFLHCYADFDFTIDYDEYKISFYRKGIINGDRKQIKVSRAEESIFVWCFFLAVMQLVINNRESYDWVQYIYIDDPISSLDDNNAIAVACDLAALIKNRTDLKVVVSTHHALFYNVLCNEIAKAERLFFSKTIRNWLYIKGYK